MARRSVSTVDAYLAQVELSVREMLEQVREIILEEAPEAEERIAYGMPSYRLNGNLVHFGVFTRHLSLFGAWPEDASARAALASYMSGKGTLQFPVGQPLPLDAIRTAIRLRVVQQRGASKDSHSGSAST